MKYLIRGTGLVIAGSVAAFMAVSGNDLDDTTPAVGSASAASMKLDKFGTGSVDPNLKGQELADLFSGYKGTERYYAYMADTKGNVPTDVAFCDVKEGSITSIRDVASQGARGIYALAASQDQVKVGSDDIVVNREARTCELRGMTFGFGSK